LALAARPLDASRVESLRKRLADADGANAMLVVADNALKSAAQQASVRNLTGQINAQLKLRAYDKVAPLVESLTAIDPTNPLIDSARKQIASNVGADGQLRIGVASFYRGQYQAAVDVLGGLVSADRPRAGFYVALSRAAQSLVAGDETQRSALRQQASQAFAAVRGKEAAFAVDLPFVSPAIKHVLGLPAQ
jgi:hypothetical protein